MTASPTSRPDNGIPPTVASPGTAPVLPVPPVPAGPAGRTREVPNGSRGPSRAAVMRRRLALGGAALAATAAAVPLWAWFGRVSDVRGVVVASVALAPELRAPATLDARRKAALGATAPGRIATVAVDVGATVRRGQQVATLDADDLAAAVAAAGAQRDEAERAVHAADAAVAHAEATAAHTAADAARTERLAAQDAATRADLDAARAAARAGAADLAQARAGAVQARAAARAAAATLDGQRAHLTDTRLTSPVGGVVTRRDVDPGDVVAAGGSVLEVVDPASLIVTARVDESVLPRLRRGLPVEVRLRSGEPATGHVDRVGREVDPDTREVTVDVALDRPPAHWALGARADVVVRTDAPAQPLAVPVAFLAGPPAARGVWRLDGTPPVGRARWQPVRTGLYAGDFVALRDGLAPGAVVLAPAGRHGGERVRVLVDSPVVGAARVGAAQVGATAPARRSPS
ncbi:hypothetical protein tb265_02320 [Gemmatimonadetes bacterium T265]|nr:hypothetical protein tb265_02320 [Gemmatimonadetes bacterium T265]